jgi:hypothetical protein
VIDHPNSTKRSLPSHTTPLALEIPIPLLLCSIILASFLILLYKPLQHKQNQYPLEVSMIVSSLTDFALVPDINVYGIIKATMPPLTPSF